MRYFAGTFLFLGSVVAGLISLFKYRATPEIVPMHWGLNGQPDRYGSRWEALLLMPIMLLVLSGVFGLIGIVSGKRLRQNATKGMNVITVFITVMLVFIHTIILSGNYNAVPTSIPYFLSTMLVVLGLSMKDIEPNPFIGIRVPWTMSSPMVWRKTHERASKLWTIGGIIGLVICLVGLPFYIPVFIFVGCLMYPLLDSYLISKSA